MFPARRGLQRLDHSRRLEPEVQKASARDLDFVAPLAGFQFGNHVAGHLARVKFPGLSQGDQGVRLVITEPGVRTGSDQDRRGVGIGQNGSHGLLQALFDERVGEHGKTTGPLDYWTTGPRSYMYRVSVREDPGRLGARRLRRFKVRTFAALGMI